MFDFDEGRNGGSEGPWVAWSARGTLDGAVPARSFYLRDESGKTRIEAFDKGVVFDLATLRIGYQKSDGVQGVAPEWTWGPSPLKLPADPGEGWKTGFTIRVALGANKAATWEQSGAGAWGALVALKPQLADYDEASGLLPLVRMTGVKVQQFKRGSTVEPVLEVVKWVPRPACLLADAEPEPAPQPAPKPQPAPAADFGDFG